MEKHSKAIIVVGMHRSGTSALSGELNNLGVFMGKRLFKAQQGVNDKGFWENARLVKINNQLLEAANSDWDDPTGLSRTDSAFPDRYFSKACDFVNSEYGNAPLWGMKDPRTSMLLPFWSRVFNHVGVSPNYILMIRHPFEVAASLAKRDGFSQQKGLVLWLNYNFASFLGTKGSPRVIVDFTALLDDPIAIRRKIASTFDLEFEEQQSFIDKSLRRQGSKELDDAAETELGEIATKLYHAIVSDDSHAVGALHKRYQAYTGQWNSVLLEHLASVQKSEIHFRNVFEEIYNTKTWKLMWPFKTLELKLRKEK